MHCMLKYRDTRRVSFCFDALDECVEEDRIRELVTDALMALPANTNCSPHHV